jgi:uncharacterized membrane protein
MLNLNNLKHIYIKDIEMFDKNQMKLFFVVLILFLIIDSIWLGLFAGPRYKKSIPEIQGEPMVINLKMAFLVYIVMTILLSLCIYKKFTPKELFIVGFSSYFIYDFTNASIFKKWDKTFGLFDSIWGGILFSVVGYVTQSTLKI